MQVVRGDVKISAYLDMEGAPCSVSYKIAVRTRNACQAAVPLWDQAVFRFPNTSWGKAWFATADQLIREQGYDPQEDVITFGCKFTVEEEQRGWM